MAPSEGVDAMKMVETLEEELKSLKQRFSSFASSLPVNPGRLDQSVDQFVDQSLNVDAEPPGVPIRRTAVESVPLNFRLQHMKSFQPFVDDAAFWIRSFETSVLLSAEPDYSFATSVLGYFIPETFRQTVQSFIDNNATWSTLKSVFVSNFTRQDPFARLVDEVHNLRQGQDEPTGVFFERLTAVLAKGEMVDVTMDSKWTKLLVPIGLRPELMEGFRRHMDLPLKEIDRVLTTEAYAKRAVGLAMSAPAPNLQLTLTDNVSPPSARVVAVDPTEKVNHVVQSAQPQHRD